MKRQRYLTVVTAALLVAIPATGRQAQQERLPVLFIIGDSTVKNSGQGLQGWGDPISDSFDRTKIRIENRARGGRSSRTFQTEGLWDQVLPEMRPGDFVLMQFGHNDGGAINDASRARGSLRGIGEETQEIDNLLTQKHEVVHTYGWYMRKYVDDTKAKGATAVVLSPIPRNIWKDGHVVRASNDYGKWAAEVAKSEGASFVDLNEIVAKRYEEVGPEKVKSWYFQEDHTHTTPAGAELNAASVVEGLRHIQNCPLTALLKAQGGITNNGSRQDSDPSVDHPSSLVVQPSWMRERLPFNSDWRFQKDDPPGSDGRLSYEKIKDWVNLTGSELSIKPNAAELRSRGNLGDDVRYTQRVFDDRGWRQLNLPHDWGIEGPFKQEYPGETGKLPWWGVGWYRKHFTVPAEDRGERFYLDIDGAMAYAVVWLNGHYVGGWPYGYASFELDLTGYIQFGAENVIAIRLDNPPDSSRWYPGGGIYRNVWLVKTGPVHVAHWGTYVTTPDVGQDTATVRMQVTLQNDSVSPANVTVRTELHELTSAGQPARSPSGSSSPVSLTIASGMSEKSDVSMRLNKPKLWSLQRPALYVAITTIDQDGKLVDRYQTFFGIRTIKFDPGTGFLLNGEHVRINGVCDHHDLGPLGAAINTRGLERQIEILKEMGVNAIRTSHNPPAPELLDLCDRMGIVVMDEAFDAWRRGKKRNDYHLLFDDWHEKDLRAQIRRDRNHPSVVLWSTGNEIGEQRRPEGQQVSESLTRIVHEEDPTRPATAACNETDAGYNGFQKTLDLFGYNYKPLEYGKFREKNPGSFLFASETASTVSSRGDYFFPVSDDKSQGRSDFQVSSYDLYAPRWAMPPDAEFRGQDEFPFVAGEFVWTGFDYLGEPTPYGADSTNLLSFSDPAEQARMAKELQGLGKIRVPSRSSYFGILDLCGFKKDRFYIYQARWRPDLPMAHILPHWNWPERMGLVTPVHVYTSAEEAELFLNGRSLGRKTKGQYQYRLRWDDVKYEPGELRVVGFKNCKKWAEDVVKTTGPVTRVALKADRNRIKADGQDLAFVTVSLTDRNGLVVPRSKNRIRFEVSGAGEIVAVDNGDATSLESLQSKERNAYNGLCLVIVRAIADKPGRITLKAQSEGLASGVVSLVAEGVRKNSF